MDAARLSLSREQTPICPPRPWGWNREIWILGKALLLARCVPLGKLLSLSGP